jgi:WD40 repeat protein
MSDSVPSPDLEARIIAAVRRLPPLDYIMRRLRVSRLLPLPLARPLLEYGHDPSAEEMVAAARSGQWFDGTPALLRLVDQSIEEATDPTLLRRVDQSTEEATDPALAAELRTLRAEVLAGLPGLPDLATAQEYIVQATAVGDWAAVIQAAHELAAAPAEAARHLAAAWAQLPIPDAQILAEHDGAIQRVLILPGGRAALVGVRATVYHRDLASGTLLQEIAAEVRGAKALAVTPDGSALLVGGHEPELRLYDLPAGTLLRRCTGQEEGAEAVAISPDGRYALSGGWDKQIRLWDLAAGTLLRTFRGHTHWVQAVAFTADGRYGLSAGYDTTLRLWDLAAPPEADRAAAVLKGNDWITTLALHPDSRYALTGSTDGMMLHWDLVAQHTVRGFGEHLNTVQEAIFSPNGRYVLTCHNDGTVRVLHLVTGRRLRSVHVDTNLHALALSPDGRTLLAGGHDGRLYRWIFPPGLLAAAEPAAKLAT